MKNETPQQSPSIPVQTLLILSFFEGSCVMVAELAGAKMLAPYFGSSLYVWASTLAVTLSALTIGYYIGGEQSKKGHEQRQKTLFVTLITASALVVLMPVLANFIMSKTVDLDFLTGLVLSQLVFLMPPILGMGMVSPLLIGLIGENNDSGKAAGLVYAISTFGGVIATLLAGFWLVPVVGISIPCVAAGAILLVLSIIILRPKKKMIINAVIMLLVSTSLFAVSRMEKPSDKYKVLYHTEGIMGQVKVVDFDYLEAHTKTTVHSRVMLVNHNWQTWIDRTNMDFSFLYYTRFSKAVISSLPKGSNALLIGLGGGTVARQLEHFDVNYDAVEIDGRLPHLAEKYFGLKKAVANTTVDDGRHFINVCKKSYDLIILDALLGESVPSHLLSLESFTKLKGLLTPAGKIFIEFDGTDKEGEGMAQAMLLNTIRAAGFQCRIFTSLPNDTHGDMMYVATLNGANNYDTAEIVKDFYYPIEGSLQRFDITNMFEQMVATNKLITDDNQVVDYYLKDRVKNFRKEYLSVYTEEFMEDNMRFYK